MPPHPPVLGYLSSNEIASSQEYSELGEELMTLLGRKELPSLQYMHLLRVSFLKGVGRGIESWHTMGNTVT